MAGASGPSVEVVIEPSSGRFDENDPRWQEQVADLHATLKTAGGDVRKRVTPVPGRKGGIEEVILALGSGGVFTGAVAVFRSWLKRDKGRALRLKATVDGKVFEFEVTGTDADDATLKRFMNIALAKFGDGG
jgi:hypothetical protein